jgi:cysteinyl-tRNA synthetase
MVAPMATLRLVNTYSNELEPFEPLDPNGKSVLLYSCGPTVYSFAHIGNFRSFLVADVLRRTLERFGYSVRHVMNITDVGHMTQDHLADAGGEDKLSKAARELGWDPYRVAQHYLDAFVEDAKLLRLKNYQDGDATDISLHPRATRYVPEMLAMIQKLIERGHAYTDSSGQVYFSIATFEDYGRLAKKDIDELISGARVDVRDEKKDPRDFALWKVDEKHLMQWNPHDAEGWIEEDWERLRKLVPGGLDDRIKKGFPGWHIECSAMAQSCLADVIDIHTGGEDNLFPHHECENAQTCGALGTMVPAPGQTEPSRRTFARFWLHGRHLLVDNRKMSKRDGTFFTVRDLLTPKEAGRDDIVKMLEEAGFDDGSVPAPVLRLALLWGHYRQSMNFSVAMLVQSRAGASRLQSLYDRASKLAGSGEATPAVTEAIASGLKKFEDALADDLQVERAIAAALNLVDELNRTDLSAGDATAALAALESIDSILDVLTRKRLGSIPKDQLDRWADDGFLREVANDHAEWTSRDDLARVHACLAAGDLPPADLLTSIAGDLDDTLIELIIAVRQLARKGKDFATADTLRDDLKRRGIAVQDSPKTIDWAIG